MLIQITGMILYPPYGRFYTGPITYASAWNETGSVSFWNKVDVIGANAYEAPTDITDPTVAQMVAGWNSVSGDSSTASLFNNLSPIDFNHSLSTAYGKACSSY